MKRTELDQLQHGIHGKGISPDGDGYKTLLEWYDLTREHKIQIGINRLRRLLNDIGRPFVGSQPNATGLTRLQVWYKSTLEDIRRHV